MKSAALFALAPGAPLEAARAALEQLPVARRLVRPVLVPAPYFVLDAGREASTAPVNVQQYRRQMAGTPRLELATIDDSRDFQMLDQPEAFAGAVPHFINRP